MKSAILLSSDILIMTQVELEMEQTLSQALVGLKDTMKIIVAPWETVEIRGERLIGRKTTSGCFYQINSLQDALHQQERADPSRHSSSCWC
jgi:hypothetical protein